eukprot:2468774-Prymnesium_polylepis.2
MPRCSSARPPGRLLCDQQHAALPDDCRLTEAILTPKANGLNARFGVPVNFAAAEPRATFIVLSSSDRGRE